MRILIVDDECAVHAAYRAAFDIDALKQGSNELTALGDELFGNGSHQHPTVSSRNHSKFDATYVHQGLDAVALVEANREENPFQVAFIDIRMPPGIDGKETAKRIRAVDPNINLVIVSGYSDFSVTDIAAHAGPADKIYYISKPFAADEVRQMASALCLRWLNDARHVTELRSKLIELAASEARAIHIANHDFLTSAPNRMAFQRELSNRLSRKSNQFALVALDLDRFKYVNDTLGHGAGDDLLIKIYTALKAVTPQGTFIARLGGDEFGILLDCADTEIGLQLCQEMVSGCAQTFEVFGSRVQVSASAGLLMSMDYSTVTDAAELMRYADMALFAAKGAGRDRVCQFDRQMDESVKFRRAVEDGLVKALNSNELRLVYQPIVDRGSLATVGFEALARWENVTHGAISPRVFIPIAEDSGLIHPIGDWIIRQALADCRNWPDQYVSINFSPKQFRQADLVDKLCARAKEAGVAHGRIQIEITETAIFDDTARAAAILNDMRQMGFRVALDDFGTGYSSLLNIKNFSLDCIKIDKSFIDNLGQDSSSIAIVRAVTHLAEALGLSVIAEGVESGLQCQALRLIGCSNMQGYLFGAGDTAIAMRERLANEQAAASDVGIQDNEPDRAIA